MPINTEGVIERAFEQTFSKALDPMLPSKAEAFCTEAFEDGSSLCQKLEQKIEQGFQRFIAEGIRWEKKKPGFKK